MSLLNFTCLRNVSQDSVTDIGWIVVHPDDDDFNLRANGYAVSIIVSIYFLIGVPWNLFVICTIVRKKLYNNPTIMLLLNLAITNLLLGLLVMPFNIITGFSGVYFFGSTDAIRCHVCQTGVFLIALPWVSVHTLSLMSVDRFIYLKKPLKYNTIVTTGKMFSAIVSIWIISAIVALPPIFGFGEVKFSFTVASCVPYVVGRTPVAPNIYYVLLMTAEAFLPITVLITMYVGVVYIVRKSIANKFQRSIAYSAKPPDEQPDDRLSQMEKEMMNAQLRLVRLFGVIFSANMLTWLPMIALALTATIVGTNQIHTLMYTFAYLAFLSETVIHPILEAYHIREVKEIMFSNLATCRKKILCCCGRRKSVTCNTNFKRAVMTSKVRYNLNSSTVQSRS